MTGAAVKLLRALRNANGADLVFPSTRGTTLSDMSLSELMRGMKLHYVPHGLRSTFRDWAAEQTAYPSDVIEMALAHTIANKVEAAYRRSDLFEKRQRLMADWTAYCEASQISRVRK